MEDNRKTYRVEFTFETSCTVYVEATSEEDARSQVEMMSPTIYANDTVGVENASIYDTSYDVDIIYIEDV